MALRPLLKLLAAVAAALLLGGSVVLAATAHNAGGPKTMRLACADNGSGKLQYANKASDCGPQHRLIRFPQDAPVTACRLDQGNTLDLRTANLAPPAHKHNVKGMLFVVSDGSKCKAPKYPHSTALTLPRPVKDLKLCAGKRRGTVRIVGRFSDCNDLEFRVVLPHHRLSVPNRAPDANDDTGLTDKEHPTTIAVLANDTDPDGDALHVASIDTSGTKGAVTIKPGGKVAYDPNGQFASLTPSQSVHDRFKYRASDGQLDSNAATVDVTVTGVNHAPVLSNVETTPLAYDTGTAATAVSPGISVSDAEGGNLQSAAVAITSGHLPGNDTLAASPPAGITSSFDDSTGVLTLTGSAPISDYETALRSVTYSSTDPTPSGTRTISFQADDGNPSNHASNVVSREVDLTNQPDPPSDITLAPTSVAENLPSGSTVGVLSTTDPDPGDSFTYALVTGTGDDDNADFQISGSTLQTNAVFDYEKKSSYSIRVRTTDSQGNSIEKQLTVTITDANDAPTDVGLSNASVDENQPADTTVGTLSSTDQESGDSHSYSLVSGAGSTDNSQFKVVGSTLETAAPLDFEAGSTRSIRVRTDDGHGGTFDKVLTIAVNDKNDAPTAIGLSSSSVPENQPSGTTVGTLSSTDQDSGDSHTYSLVSGTGSTDNGSFQISGSTLETNATFDFETKSSYAIRVKTDDGNGGTFEQQLTISVSDQNDTPTDLALNTSTVPENSSLGTTVGNFSTTDQDTADGHTYSLVTGTGDTDNGSFTINGSALQTNTLLDFETKASYSIRVKTDDGNGGTFEKQLTIDVSDQNDAPSDIALSNSSVDENQPSGTTVGSLSSTDQDSGDSHTYSLVSGTGSTDNGSFQISGSTLETKAPLDFEAGSTRSIRVRTDDGHGGTFDKVLTITVNDLNDAPTDIGLSSSSVPENQPSGTTVGTFSTTDQDSADSHTYALVAGTGSTDNGSFSLDPGGELKTAATFDYETKSSYSIRVKTDDGHGGTYEKVFTISVTNGEDAPTDLGLSPSSIAENQPSGSDVGTLSTTDQDTADSHTYSLVTGTGDGDNASFQISGSTLQTNAIFDYETKSSYSIRVKTDDGNGGTFEKALTVSVTDANDAPTDIALSKSSIVSDKPSGTTVGTLSSTDQDASDSHTYSLVSGTGSDDNGSFQISGDTLKTATSVPTGTYHVRIRTNDGHGGTFDKQFTITATPNSTPTDIGLSNSSVDENQPSGTTVGTLSTTDADAGDSHTYSLVSGTGSDDNAQFQISGDTLETNASFDFEQKASYSIRVQTDDGHGGTFEKQFTVSVNNVNDAPTDIALSNSSVDENAGDAAVVGTLSTTDQDTADSHTYSLVTGTGDTDNGDFTITGGATLEATQSFDFETKSSYSIRLKTDDGNGGTFEKQFTITVNDKNDAPTDLSLDTSTVPENSPLGTTVGNFSSTDQDSGDTHTYTLVSGTGSDDNASFTINGTALQTNALLDYETKSSYKIRVRTDDGNGGTFEKALTITVSDQNDAPTDIGLSKSNVDENQPSGTTVGSFSATDQDSGDTHSYSLVSGTGDTDNAQFTIDSSGNLKTAASFDFETKSSYSIRVRTTDSGGLTYEKQFTISVNDKNDPPTDIGLSKSDLNENQPSGTTIGSFSSTDQDAGDTHTYTLVSGTGSTDNASFTIDSSGNLKSGASFNYEAKNSYSIRVRTTDSGGATFEKQFTITIDDVNDAPVANADSYSGVVGNTTAAVGTSPSGPSVTLSGNKLIANDTDEDQTFPHTVSAVAETVSSTGGGSATINSDGSFTYTPPAGAENTTDTFTYHATDGSLTSAGTVTMHIANVRVWYLNNSLSSNGNGTSASPFNSLSPVNGAGGSGDSDASGDYLFLYGSGNYSGGLPLEANEQLIGQPNGLVVNNGFGNQTLVSSSGGTASDNPTIQNSGGDAIQLANGSDIERVNAGTASGAGVKGSSITTATMGSTTTISGASGGALSLTGAAGGNISIGAAITNSSGKSVTVQNRSSGTVALSGDVNDTGTGIVLSGNTGATINLSGKLTASTGANAAFSATSGGTVNTTGSGSALTTTTGLAVDIEDTTIGASGVNFKSVSANGAANGIKLSNTGATGGLSVAGGGNTSQGGDASGGTIQNTTGPAVSLSNTKNVSLNDVKIDSPARAGVRGTLVNGFSITNSTVQHAGESAANVNAPLDYALSFNATDNNKNLEGALTVNNNELLDDWYGGLKVIQYDGTISDAQINNNLITQTTSDQDGDGIGMNLNGTSSTAAALTKATISNNTLNTVQGSGISLLGGNSSTATAPNANIGIASGNTPNTGTSIVTITGNSMTGAAQAGSDHTAMMNGNAIVTGVDGRGSANVSITGNGTAAAPLENFRGTGIGTGGSGDGTQNYYVSDNYVQPNDTNDNNSVGMGVAADKNNQTDGSVLYNPTIDAIVSNNHVSQSNGFGFRALASDSSATLNVRSQNNNVGAPSNHTFPSMEFDAGTNSDSTHHVTGCYDVSGNTAAAGSAPDGFGNTTSGIVMRERTAANLKLVGLSNGSSAAQAESYEGGLNPASGTGSAGFDSAKVAVFTSGGGTVDGCTLPFP